MLLGAFAAVGLTLSTGGSEMGGRRASPSTPTGAAGRGAAIAETVRPTKGGRACRSVTVAEAASTGPSRITSTRTGVARVASRASDTAARQGLVTRGRILGPSRKVPARQDYASTK